MATEAPSTSTPPDTGALTPEAGASLLDTLMSTTVVDEPEKSAPEVSPKAEDIAPLDAPVEEDKTEGPVLYEVKEDDGTTSKVTLDELQKGYHRRQNYDRRVTKHQQEVKAFEAQRAKEQADVKAARDQYALKLEKMEAALNDLAPQEPDWEKIRQETPDQFTTAVAEWSVIKEKRQKLAEARQKIADEQAKEEYDSLQARLADEAEKLSEIIPDLKDEKKAPALKERLLAEGEHRGFTRAEVAQTRDHRLVAILHDAMLYRDLLAKRDEMLKTKPSKDAPKTVPAVEPGARPAQLPKGRKDAQAAFARLKETGSKFDAARVLESLDF